jgi:uncharacterized protein YndB with AHSA1/START domain
MDVQTAPDATASQTIGASPDAIWRAITDIGSIRTRSPETFAAKWTRGDGPVAGARFRGWNRNGPFVWATTCTVTDAEPGRSFAFDVTFLGMASSTWRWDVEPEGAGSRVTLSTWDSRQGSMKVLGTVGTGVTDRAKHNQAGIEETLRRLAASLETSTL